MGAMLVSCASKVKIYDGSIIGGHDYCQWDQIEVDKFIESQGYAMEAYYNEKVFDSNKYGDQKFQTMVKSHTAPVTAGKNVIQMLEVQKNNLIDETDIVQLGQADYATFFTTKMAVEMPSRWEEWPTKQNPTIYSRQAIEFVLDPVE